MSKRPTVPLVISKVETDALYSSWAHYAYIQLNTDYVPNTGLGVGDKTVS